MDYEHLGCSVLTVADGSDTSLVYPTYLHEHYWWSDPRGAATGTGCSPGMVRSWTHEECGLTGTGTGN